MPGAGLSRRSPRKAPLGQSAFQPYWGKLAVRNDRGDRGNVGIIRSPIRASILPDRRRHRLSHAQRQLNPFAHAALLLEHTMEGGIASSVAQSCIVGTFRLRQSGSQIETKNRRYTGPRSGPGCSVPVRHHLIGPIRPTRGHIAISPHSGLYAMPSLCGSA
jgi:hypothetical protein